MKYFLLFLFLFLPTQVYASSAYLKEIEVQNGTLSIPFNEKNNVYTIYLEEDATFVDFTYQLEENAELEIIDKDYREDRENVMILKVKTNDHLESQTYTFYLEKEEDTKVALESANTFELNISPKERSPYLAPLIIGTCFIIILFLFYFLIVRYFKKGKKKVLKKKSLT